MKNKGFTLIELLAVIVILAIIAVIAIPRILNVVEEAKKGAAEASALGYIDAVEKQVMQNQLKNDNLIQDGEYNDVVTFNTNNNIRVSGKLPLSGNITLLKGKVTNANLCINGYNVTFNGSKATASTKCGDSNSGGQAVKPGPNMESAKEGETHKGIVYLDPTDLSKTCTKTMAEDNVVNGSPTGVKEDCMKWYIFKEDSTKYYMILDHNTSVAVRWSKYGGNNSSMIEAASALSTDTEGWEVTARLITAKEVADATGHGSTFTGTSCGKWFMFGRTEDNNGVSYANQSEEEKARQRSYHWLFDNLKLCSSNGCSIEKVGDYAPYNYWTSTPYTYNGGTENCYNVSYEGKLGKSQCSGQYAGIRPVIEVNKSLID